jgi:hypothetical protein
MRRPFLSASLFSGFAAAAHRLLSRRLRRRRRSGWADPFHFFAFLAAGVVAHATSVTPPSFSELVSEAQVIARGTVTSVSARWVDAPQGRMIKTFVDFTVEKRIKGNPAATMTLQFLGGTVGTDTMHVSGMPEFKVGQTDILFITGNGIQFCPLVRFGHGRYHVRTDAASHRKYVTRNDESPLASVADVKVPETDHPVAKAIRSAEAALSPDEFETQISDELAREKR